MELLVAIILLFVFTPFLEGMRHGNFIEVILVTFVLLSSVLAVGVRRRTMVLAAILAAPAVVGRWICHFRPDWFPHPLFLALAMVFITFAISRLLGFVLRAPRVDAEVLCASISAYLLIGLAWAFAYAFLGVITPDAFAFSTPPPHKMQGFNAFYFSFVTLSTVGYGDITPLSSVARMLAVVEAMTGLLYVAVLIARLVSLYSAPLPPSAGGADSSH
jgi:hypothetical protein